ncbi:hypothetical protein EX30DRAFT_130529 [Ascodesmis nigricans]|uniref:Uncharacterized protein n=1 Tax=Ascodesmis nigricans TaxID=341454 RepID=A0A4S2MNP1_9PEZI|nr:hypothetical protein EX30DRAFT_130529 [Ascodesmis nigricans]
MAQPCFHQPGNSFQCPPEHGLQMSGHRVVPKTLRQHALSEVYRHSKLSAWPCIFDYGKIGTAGFSPGSIDGYNTLTGSVSHFRSCRDRVCG